MASSDIFYNQLSFQSVTDVK